MTVIDSTHDAALESWVASAQAPDGDFPLQNLPYGRFRTEAGPWRLGVAIGEEILDLNRAGVVGFDDARTLLGLSVGERQSLRARLSAGLRRGSDCETAWRSALVPQAAAEIGLPCDIHGYTDFYTGIHHATAVGRLFRPDNPLLPNYKYVPIGYHGRTSSLLPSGVPVRRPRGQVKKPDVAAPALVPSARLDYELELGIVVGRGNTLGEAIGIADAEEHIFGLTLLNDWSARDVQAWEYQPLGPFLAKNFATTLSCWLVTTEALAPFRRPFVRAAGEPELLPYLDSAANRAQGAVAIDLEVFLRTSRMRSKGLPAARLSQSSYLDAYWTMGQLVAHHTVNGCNLMSGDLLGSGTLSGPEADQGGSLLELSAGGTRPVALPDGEERRFLEDGDEVSLHASCSTAGFRRIGFGTCVGTVLPALGG